MIRHQAGSDDANLHCNFETDGVHPTSANRDRARRALAFHTGIILSRNYLLLAVPAIPYVATGSVMSAAA
jgi:hypothetical protein